MKYKLVALDLDGTLLHSDNSVSEYTFSILKELDRRGIKVVIATGRSYTSLKPKIERLKLEHPVVCYNGAMIRDGKNDEIIFESKLSLDLSKELIDISRRESLYLHGFINGDFHYEKECKQSEYYRELSGLLGVKIDFDKIKNTELTKAMFIGEHQDLLKIEKELKARFSDKIFVAFSKPIFLEVMDVSASKSKALDRLVKQYEIEPKDVIAFGDGLNDEDMLSYAGKGVVMKNGHELLRSRFETCDYTNDEDGVAKYLDRLLNE